MSPGSTDVTKASSPRYLVGCVLALCVPITVLLALGTVVGVTSQLVKPDPTVPHPIVLAIVSGGILAALCALFAMITKRLFAAYRGEPVAQLMPVWLSVLLAGALGIGGFASLIFSAHAHSVSAVAASGAFLMYAIAAIRQRLAKRT